MLYCVTTENARSHFQYYKLTMLKYTIIWKFLIYDIEVTEKLEESEITRCTKII